VPRIPGTAAKPEEIPDGMYQLVCSGYSTYAHTRTEQYSGWKYGVMVLRGHESNDCYAVMLEMAKVIPQLKKGIHGIAYDEYCFGRMVEAYKQIDVAKEGSHFRLLVEGGATLLAEFNI